MTPSPSLLNNLTSLERDGQTTLPLREASETTELFSQLTEELSTITAQHFLSHNLSLHLLQHL